MVKRSLTGAHEFNARVATEGHPYIYGEGINSV